MCNWRSAFPRGFTPHTPLTLTPLLPPYCTLLPHPSPSIPSQHPLLLLLGWSVLLLSPSRWSFSRPAPSLPFFCRSLRRHKITEAALTSLSAWPNTLPFSSHPPSPLLLLLHSRIHHTLAWATHYYYYTFKIKKIKGENKNTERKMQLRFPHPTDSTWNKHSKVMYIRLGLSFSIQRKLISQFHRNQLKCFC